VVLLRPGHEARYTLEQMPQWLNLPNLFTILRLVLVPFIIRDIFDGRHLRALELFAIAAVTDFLDGAAARRFGSATPAGAYLDPIADKALLSGVYLALAIRGIMPWWLVAIVFGRDLYILLGVCLFLAFSSIRRFPPSVWGKASTFVQIVTLVVWMARNALDVPLLEPFADATLWPCAALTVWSGIDYTRRGIQFAKGD
jgi:cardiolipin synthase (CMP-forming)